MFWKIATWLISSNGSKTAGVAALGSSGLLALVFSLHADVKKEINDQEYELHEHVEMTLKPVEVEIRNLNDNQKETNKMIRDIHNHLLNGR